MTNRWVVPAAALNYASFALPISMLGVVWPEVRSDFDQSLGTLGLVGLIYGVARMSSATTGRPLVSRVGTGRAFVLALGLFVGANALLASSTSWPLFLVFVASVGVVSGMLDSIGATFIAALGDVSSAGLIHGFYGFGATVGPLLVAAMPGWRLPLATAAGIAAVALSVAVVVRDLWPASAAHELDAHSEANLDPATDVPAGAVDGAVDGVPGRLPQVEASNAMIAVSLVLFAAFVAVEVTTGQWVYTYLTDGRGLDDTPAAIGVAAFWAGLMVGRLLMANRWVAAMTSRAGLGGLAGVSALAVGALTLLPAGIAVVPLLVSGLALAPIVPTLFATTTSRVGAKRSASVAGWQLLATNAGAISVPTLTGALVDSTSPTVIVVVIIITLGVVGGPLVLVLDRLTSGGTSPAAASL